MADLADFAHYGTAKGDNILNKVTVQVCKRVRLRDDDDKHPNFPLRARWERITGTLEGQEGKLTRIQSWELHPNAGIDVTLPKGTWPVGDEPEEPDVFDNVEVDSSARTGRPSGLLGSADGSVSDAVEIVT